MFWHLIWPALLALALWLGIAFLFWGQMSAALLAGLRAVPIMGGLLADGSLIGITSAILAHFFLAALLLPLAYVTALLLVGVFALPLMLDRLGRDEYPDLEMRRGGSQWISLFNALSASVLFLLLLLLSLPFWLIPGLGFLLPLLLAAWLNQRVYRYDALMIHADRDELDILQRQCRGGLMWVGLAAGLLAWVPFVNLLAPAFAGLASIHLCLEALRRHRPLPVKGSGATGCRALVVRE